MKYCSICNKPFDGYGNNPEPVQRYSKGPCCDLCNYSTVIPTRLMKLRQGATK